MRSTSLRGPGLPVMLILLAIAVMASLMIGSRSTGPGEILAALSTWGGDESDVGVILWDLRIPRTILGVVVGAALGMAGALTQAHTRNPLADPGMLGITAGAALAVVLSVFAFGVGSATGHVWAALLGAALGAVIVFGISSIGGGGANPLSLILAGAALTAFFTAMTTAMVLLDQNSLEQMRFWNAGSLAGRDLAVLAGVLPFLLTGAVIALASGPALNVISIGVDAATGLGVTVWRARILGLVAVTLLAGAATAAAGPIGFVGLAVPHLVRVFTGPDHRWILPYSALAGAILVLAADVVGRVVMRPGEVQVGVVLAFVGAPFFIALVRRRKLVAL